MKATIKSLDKMADRKMGMVDSPKEEAGESKKFEKYELENAVRTLHEAEEIKQDAELMKAIQPMLDKKSKAIRSLDDLRAVAKEKASEAV